MDGMSLALTYRDGKLFSGVTRGDGTVGEDVTTNIMPMRSVPFDHQPCSAEEGRHAGGF